MVSDKNDANLCREEIDKSISYIQDKMNYILNYEEDLEGLKEEKKKEPVNDTESKEEKQTTLG